MSQAGQAVLLLLREDLRQVSRSRYLKSRNPSDGVTAPVIALSPPFSGEGLPSMEEGQWKERA